MDGWNTIVSFWDGLFSGPEMLVSGSVFVLANVIFTCYCDIYLGLSPFPVVVTTGILTLLIGDPYRPSFATVTGKGHTSIYT